MKLSDLKELGQDYILSKKLSGIWFQVLWFLSTSHNWEPLSILVILKVWYAILYGV